jgi:O-antigen/teichoic acid export membrane protein
MESNSSGLSDESKLLQGRRTGGTLLATAVIQSLGVLSGALVARLLGVTDRGLLAAIVLWPAIVAYVGDIGGPSAFIYISSAHRERRTALLGSALGLAATQSAVILLLGLPLATLALHSYSSILLIGLLFTVAYVPINVLTRYLNALNQGAGHFGQFNAVRLAVQLTYVTGVALLFVLHQSHLGLVVIVTVLSNVAALTIAARPLYRSRLGTLRPDFELIRQTFSYGVRAHLGNLRPMESLQLDLAAVFVLLGPRAAGLYTISISSTIALRAAGASLGMVAFPSVASAVGIQRRREALGRWFRLGLLMLAPPAVVLGVLAGFLVPLVYGAAFEGAVPVVRILAISSVMASLSIVLGDFLRGAGEPLMASLSEAASLAVGVLLLALLIPRYGIIGAGLAASGAYAAAVTASLLFALRVVGLRPSELLMPNREDFQAALTVMQDIVHTVRAAISTRTR